VYDSQKLAELLTKANTSLTCSATAPIAASEIEERLRTGGFKSRIYLRATRKRSLSEAQANASHNGSKIRARVEHVFAVHHTRAGRPDRTHDRHRASGAPKLAYRTWPTTFAAFDAGADRRRMTASGKHAEGR
jgi:hypothetical protein